MCIRDSDYALAARLWKEDIRECRLLAAMLMPAETYTAELADLWVEQMRYNEEAECTVMYLFARLSCASAKAFEWVAREEKMFRLCGWLLMGRLLAGGAVPSERDEEELLDQLAAELGGNDAAVARAAQADAVAGFVRANARRPLILCGDFNDTPVSYTRCRIARAGLTDAYEARGTGIGRSFYRDAIYVRIDHIFCSGHFRPVSCHTDPGFTVADHCPVFAVLARRPAP